MPDNISVLTKGHKTYAKKRKARREQVEEVQFDPEARRTFLTGFHKRKVQRREQAIASAKQKEREERLELRREKRQAEKEQLAQKIMTNKGGIDDAGGNGSDGEGDADPESQDENADVEVMLHGDTAVTTVTVTHDFDPTRVGDSDLRLDAKLSAQEIALNMEKDALKTLRRHNQPDGSSDDDDDDGKKKQKKSSKKPTKKFRYETKAKRATRNASAAAGKKKKKGTSKTVSAASGKATTRRR
ncbi:hypothetical protein LPJ72_000994 [Coemansia sp. Benny D160-2]|nr:hypothetical protein LPJ72_000994 [Coemansia sp. Benny D160-2]